MRKTDEISSTEKLLHVIRNRDESARSNPEKAEREADGQAFKPSLLTLVPFTKKTTLSVVIGTHELTLVLVSRLSDQEWGLLDHQRVPFPPGVRNEFRHLSTFLKNIIPAFLGSRKPDFVWSTIPSVKMDTRYLSIPRVAPNQIPNVAYFAFNKVIPVQGEDLIFDFEILGESTRGRSRKIELFAYTAVAGEVAQVRRLFAAIGYPLTGISIVPFAIQNLFRTHLLGELPDNVCTLYVGTDWSRIDIFSKGNLVLSRDIKTGINSILDAVRSRMPEIDREDDALEEEPAAAGDPAVSDLILKEVFSGPMTNGADEDTVHPQQARMKETITPVINRLVRQIERTFEHFMVNFKEDAVGKVFITGDLCAYPQIVGLISRQLNLKIDFINPFHTDKIRITDQAVPETVVEQDAFVPAMGLAVSDNRRTPNLLHTYLQRGTADRIQKINQVVFLIFLAIICACIGIYAWQDHRLDGKKQTIAQLQSRLETFNPRVEKNLLLKMMSMLETRRRTNLDRAENSLGLAILSELAQLTPENIRLTRMGAKFLDNPFSASESRLVLIEGLVKPKNTSPDADLAVYLIRLGESPIFRQVTVRDKSVQTVNGEKVLTFVMKLEPV